MDQYENYSADDFFWDLLFRQWVVAPTRETNQLWTQWLREHPEQEQSVQEAREAILALRVQEPSLGEQEVRKVVETIITKAALGERTKSMNRSRKTVALHRRRWWLFAAASISLLLAAGLLYHSTPSTPLTLIVPHEQETMTEAPPHLTRTVNTSDLPLTVSLDDGSTIVLGKGSQISYPLRFSDQKREVHLSGEAFFDVARDSDRPFYVYANELVTKVLGTSFTIQAYETSHEVTVEVKTGRVSVYARSDPKVRQKASSRELEGVVLSPNQRVVYSRNEVRINKSLVKKPRMVVPEPDAMRFEFEDTPVPSVFARLEKAYGVTIVYDEVLMQGCPLTAELNGLSLYQKLTIICKAIDAEYEILDGQIVIHGKGCKS
ncbi:FecR family protein [Telluribacter sp.]|jgi:ferric-dicitrate binding protein FerR (iron transport regulator)|uniref:FecR family protein n=1 Tax=Telluribacter sp. TaxID=1978767 RepID=UPI002E132958|nr:FecR domain-containing protein [Telluribacter sp.]